MIARLLEFARRLGRHRETGFPADPLQEKLGFVLSKHGLEPRYAGQWVVAGDPFPAFQVSRVNYTEYGKLDAICISARLDETATIVEEFAITDKHDPESANLAIVRFSLSMLHPILSGCGLWTDDPHTLHEKWHCANHSDFDVSIGDAAIYRPEDAPPIEIPEQWIDGLQAAIADTQLRPGYNWISAYCSRIRSDRIDGQSMLNNAHWPAGWAATEAVSWPVAEPHFGIRLFILMRVA